MKSQKVLRKVLRAGNAKQIAADVGVSLSTLYKWTEEGESHRTSPLERVAALYRSSGNRRPVCWLCEQAGGFFIVNPKAVQLPAELLVVAMGRVHEELAGLQRLVAVAEKDNGITRKQSKRLRKRWEKSKSVLEGFVVRCEGGGFGKRPPLPSIGLAG